MNNNINKPTFLGVGTQKGGTTSMYSILKRHPQIFLPNTKEIHFFDKNYDENSDIYYSFFKEAKTEHKAIGEITPNYMYDPNVPERIYKNLGQDIKLIFILRNPADRAFSNYKMNIERNNETNTFKQAIEKDLKKIKNNEDYRVVFHYIKRGFYAEQIKRFYKYFDKENMLFLLFEEDTIKNREKSFEKIYEFIGVDKLNIPVNIKITPNVRHKSKKADKILNTAHPINQLAKKIISNKNLRTNIKYFFTKLNQKPTADKSELIEMRPYLINEIYKESILELQDLIDRKLDNWLRI